MAQPSEVKPPTDEEIARWDRWFACEMNNLAWDLAAKPSRTPAEQEQMLDAAHAAAIHWRRIGTELNSARADMLLAHTHALAGNGAAAIQFARRSHQYFTTHDTPDWEIAFSHAILAQSAHASGDPALHATHHALAKTASANIADPEERKIFETTFAQMPLP